MPQIHRTIYWSVYSLLFRWPGPDLFWLLGKSSEKISEHIAQVEYLFKIFCLEMLAESFNVVKSIRKGITKMCLHKVRLLLSLIEERECVRVRNPVWILLAHSFGVDNFLLSRPCVPLRGVMGLENMDHVRKRVKRNRVAPWRKETIWSRKWKWLRRSEWESMYANCPSFQLFWVSGITLSWLPSLSHRLEHPKSIWSMHDSKRKLWEVLI